MKYKIIIIMFAMIILIGNVRADYNFNMTIENKTFEFNAQIYEDFIEDYGNYQQNWTMVYYQVKNYNLSSQLLTQEYYCNKSFRGKKYWENETLTNGSIVLVRKIDYNCTRKYYLQYVRRSIRKDILLYYEDYNEPNIEEDEFSENWDIKYIFKWIKNKIDKLLNRQNLIIERMELEHDCWDLPLNQVQSCMRGI